MTGIVIQARKGSTRLPNKMVLPFYKEKGVLELLFEKLTTHYSTEKIVLATTINTIDDELIAIAQKFNIKTYRGSEDNVLERFIKAATQFNFKTIIRICADNPFLDIEHISQFISEIEHNNLDYVSYKLPNGLPTIKSHLGLFTEAVSLKALLSVSKSTSLSLYQEHVTNYIYTHPESYKIQLLEMPNYMANTENIRLTLDTIEDFKLEQDLYKKMKSKSVETLVNYLKNNQVLLEKMKHEISKHSK
ncbi:hypothetical protein EGM88_14335 [Aureibaculum marinum]|uniref:Aminotransferase n=1 Tax=Aureibaculum marinum TaxID=2487930 RepID=A0A3N4N5X3_9FLAO|nr:hypothetical protein [Aureibaculum marinum]RPD91714.1 hypothetical protein EGM88_14335 [Aureibaculum marinum]